MAKSSTRDGKPSKRFARTRFSSPTLPHLLLTPSHITPSDALGSLLLLKPTSCTTFLRNQGPSCLALMEFRRRAGGRERTLHSRAVARIAHIGNGKGGSRTSFRVNRAHSPTHWMNTQTVIG